MPAWVKYLSALHSGDIKRCIQMSVLAEQIVGPIRGQILFAGISEVFSLCFSAVAACEMEGNGVC